MRDNKTIILLDVDGVINFFPSNFRWLDDDVKAPFPDGEVGRAHPDADGYGRSYEINWSPTLIEGLLNLHNWGGAEIVWLTTWGSGANAELSQLVGLPGDLRVAGEPPSRSSRFHTEEDSYEERDDWWKFTCAKRIAREHPDSRIVWLDDDLYSDRAAMTWVLEQGDRVLGICPDHDLGLTPQDLLAISKFVLEG